MLIALFAALFFMQGQRPERAAGSAYDLDGFAHLPVMHEGRRKPVDTLARNLLRVLSGKSSLRAEAGHRLGANQWLLDNLSGRPEALDHRAIRITHPDLLASMGLEARKRFRYTYREIIPALPRLDAAMQAARRKDRRDRDLYDRQAIDLASRLVLFQTTVAAFEDARLTPPDELFQTMQRYMQLEKQSIPLVVPPTGGHEKWQPLMRSLLAAHPAVQEIRDRNGIHANPLALRFGAMLSAYAAGKVDAFNEFLTGYRVQLEREAPEQLERIGFEVAFNRMDAFMKAAQLYLLVFIVSCFGWLLRRNGLLDAARWIMMLAFALHTFALVARSFLSGYPPVTNLYSSAIFIGWAAVAAGIVMEMGFRKQVAGIGNLVGGITGSLTLLIAHFLAGDGDTLEQMRAVLDTRFWLATHVITITLGYTATFVAGVIGIFYIMAGLFTQRIDAGTKFGMDRMIYGTICFAMLFSFVGTVLGGLWADDSWGRFWGWDPKENGALLIVMWCAIMLHARWGRMVGSRGFAVMAVFGNIVTAWSWFGVNQLGVGLHSYGFTDSTDLWLTGFCLSQLLIGLLGMLPVRFWKSGTLPL